MGNRTRWAAIAAAAAGLVVSACSSDASTRTDEATPEEAADAEPVAVPDSVPEGTTLRVGDQLEFLQTVLHLAGEDTDLPYEVEYSAFVGGPPMLQAFQGGALDTGFVGSTPLIFAQAQGQDLVAIAGWASEGGAYGLLTAPGVDDIAGWDDLAGKRVAYQRGTAAEAALLQALDTAGIDPAEVTTVDVPITQGTAALQGGSADAALTVEPLTSVFLASNPGAEVVATADEITDRSSFLIATEEALADDARTAALADYTTRLVRAFAYTRAHPEEVVQAIYVDQYGLRPERAAEVVEAQGIGRFLDLPDDIVDAQQRLADLFVAADQIPAEIDVAAQFDTRFRDVVEAAQASEPAT